MKSIDNGSDQRKVIVAIASNPALVEIQESVKVEKPPRETDPFTKEALESRPDTPEEKALLGAYQAIEGKKKRIRRTKAQIEADNAAKTGKLKDDRPELVEALKTPAVAMAEKVVNHESP